MYKHILISTDGSDVARKGVDHGLALAKSLGAKATIVTVTERYPVYPSPDWIPGPAEMEAYATIQKESAGKILADVTFYIPAIISYELLRRRAQPIIAELSTATH